MRESCYVVTLFYSRILIRAGEFYETSEVGRVCFDGRVLFEVLDLGFCIDPTFE